MLHLIFPKLRLAAAQCGKAVPYQQRYQEILRLRLKQGGKASNNSGYELSGKVSLTALCGGKAATNTSEVSLLILPLGNATGCPGCARCFHLFLESCQVTFDQLPQLRQRCFKVLRCNCILIHLCLRRTRCRHALRPDDVADALADGRRQVDVTRSQRGIASQRAQDFIGSLVETGRISEQLIPSRRC